MEKCKYCQAELAENGTFCPNCGRNNAEEMAEETVTEQVLEETTPVPEPAVEEAAPVQEVQPTEIKEGTKATPGKIALMVGAIVVVAAVIIALLVGTLGKDPNVVDSAIEPAASNTEATEETVPATVPADGNPDDETCKGTYTGSDEDVIANADTVVATAGEFQLTNSQLQVFYWMDVQTFLNNYSYYASMMGLDYTQPLDTQLCSMSETGGTWQQFFLANALDSWHYYQSLYAEAEKAGYDVDAQTREFLDTLEESIAADAEAYGFANADEYLAYNVGKGATMEDYIHFMELYYRGYGYFNEQYKTLTPTAEEIEEFFTENEATYAESGITRDGKYVDVRHILIMPESTTAEDGTTTISDEAWAASEAEAKKILDMWKSGGTEEERTLNGWKSAAGTEEFFAELANTFTHDGNDADYDGEPDGGLYTNVTVGQMVEPFENWCFDESRKAGDTGLVQTTYGWHVMYFVDSYPIWESYAESDLMTERANALVDEISGGYPIDVNYESILLGYLNLGA